MNARDAFTRLLDEKLTTVAGSPGGEGGSEARVATPAFWGLPGAASVSCGLGGQLPIGWVDSSRLTRERDGATATVTHPCRSRRLSATQQRALGRLQRLGALALDASFTDDQLRRAFRFLAKKLHPDRHPAASAAERARLASSFVALCESYRELTAPAS